MHYFPLLISREFEFIKGPRDVFSNLTSFPLFLLRQFKRQLPRNICDLDFIARDLRTVILIINIQQQ